MKAIIFAALVACSLANKQAYYDLSGDDVEESIDVEAPTAVPDAAPADVANDQSVEVGQYTFEDIVALVKDNASVQDLAGDITAQFSAYYNDIVLTLPEVCDGKAAAFDGNGNVVSASTGKVCRAEYALASKQAVSAQWQSALLAIRGELEDLFLVS